MFKGDLTFGFYQGDLVRILKISTKSIFFYSGWPRRRPLRAAGVQHGGGDPPVAPPEVPRDGAAEDGGRDGRALPGRPAALGRQLRAPLRLHLRLPPLLRTLAVRHARGRRRRERRRGTVRQVSLPQHSKPAQNTIMFIKMGPRLRDVASGEVATVRITQPRAHLFDHLCTLCIRI